MELDGEESVIIFFEGNKQILAKNVETIEDLCSFLLEREIVCEPNDGSNRKLHWTGLELNGKKPFSKSEKLKVFVQNNEIELVCRFNIQTICHKIEKKREHIKFDVEFWYPLIREQTFDTKSIPIDIETAKSIVKFYRCYWYNEKKGLEDHHVELLRALYSKLDESMKKFGDCFVRASSRSPKDAMSPFSEKILDVYERIHRSSGRDNSANSRLVSLFNAQSQSLVSRSAKDAMHRILTSERVFVDLIEAIGAQEDESEEWSTSFLIRKWNAQLRDDLEFRCFVFESQMTAISQYNDYVVYDGLKEKMDGISECLQKFWKNHIRDKIPMRSYIVDFGVIPNTKDNDYDVVLIELNPYARTTGSALFHWDEKEELENADSVSVRVRETLIANIEEFCEFNFEEIEKVQKDPKPFTDIIEIEDDKKCIVC